MRNTFNSLRTNSYNRLKKIISKTKNKTPVVVDDDYRFILSHNAEAAIQQYQVDLATEAKIPGEYLKERILKRMNKPNATNSEISSFIASINVYEFLELIVQSKQIKVFSESEVKGNGKDWNRTELELLNLINTVAPVTIYDNGNYGASKVVVHKKPFQGYLLFTNGVRLKQAEGSVSPDADAVIKEDGTIDKYAYRKLYEERLIPLLLEANRIAGLNGKQALISIPGLGCGSFAGDFANIIKPIFRDTLLQILSDHQHELPNIRGVVFDSFDGCEREDKTVGHMDFLVRRSKDENGMGVLSPPSTYGDKYKDCLLFSTVAGEPCSRLGCDLMYGLNREQKGLRNTNEGAVAAGTDLMQRVNHIEGKYNPEPPAPMFNVASDPNKSWGSVVEKSNVQLTVRNARSYSVRPVPPTKKVEDALNALQLYIHNSTVSGRGNSLARNRKESVNQVLDTVHQALKTFKTYEERVYYLNNMIENQRLNTPAHYRSVGGLIKRMINADTTVNKLLIDYLTQLRDIQRYDETGPNIQGNVTNRNFTLRNR